MKRLLSLLALAILGVGLWAGNMPAQAQATDTYTPSFTPTRTPQPTLTPGYGPIRSPEACGLPYNPCGPLPFPVPRFPTLRLPSPTALPTIPSPTPIPITVTPSETPTTTPITETPTPSITPSPTSTGTITGGMEGIATLTDGLGGISQTLAAQATVQLVINGTPQAPPEIAGQLGGFLGGFFGVLRMFGEQFGPAGWLVNFLILCFAFVLLVYIVTWIAPILLAFVRIILQMIQAFKPF